MTASSQSFIPLTGLAWLTGLALTVSVRAAEPPSKVENAVTEASLPTLQLTAQAVKRLGIAVAAVERKAMEPVRLYPGSVRLPLGDAADILAPAPVSSAEELRKLAELQTIADGAVEAAKAAQDVAVQARKRAETLSVARAGSERVLDEAKAAELQTKAAWSTAAKNRTLLGQAAAEVAVSPRRWIAVTVPAIDLAHLDTQAAQIKTTPGAAGKTIAAKPVARTSTALPGGGVEIFFELSDETLPQGQQVEVQLKEKTAPGAAAATSLAVPWSCVVHDATGGTWVYEQKTAESFTRRRVDVIRVSGDAAFLAAGPAEGTKVVSVGVAELFGAEFGGFK